MNRAELLSQYEAGQHDFSEVDLSGEDLHEVDLSQAMLRKANLAGANLTRANLRGANLREANLEGADLTEAQLHWIDRGSQTYHLGANLSRANLSRTKLCQADLRYADMTQTILHGADLSQAKLNSATMREVKLHGANLTNANLKGARLTNARYDHQTVWTEDFVPEVIGAKLDEPDADPEEETEPPKITRQQVSVLLKQLNLQDINLSGYDLSGVDLAGFNLRLVNLNRANLSRANLSQANMGSTRLYRANFSGADLSFATLSTNLKEADFSGANLSHAKMQGAIMRQAVLADAKLRHANLRRADLTRADLRGANLQYADLSHVNLRQADLTDADLTGAKVGDIRVAETKVEGATLPSDFPDPTKPATITVSQTKPATTTAKAAAAAATSARTTKPAPTTRSTATTRPKPSRPVQQERELGAHQARYKANPTPGKLALYLSPVALLLTGLFFWLGRSAALQTSALGWYSLAVLAFLLAGGGYYYYIYHSSLQIDLHQNGFIAQHWFGKQPFYWDRLAEVYQATSGASGSSLRRRYQIYLQDGEGVSLNNILTGLDQLDPTIEREIGRHIQPKAIKTYESGGIVYFGPRLALDRQGLRSGQDRLSWAELDRVQGAAGEKVTIYRKGDSHPWQSLPPGQVANRPVLQAMIETIDQYGQHDDQVDPKNQNEHIFPPQAEARFAERAVAARNRLLTWLVVGLVLGGLLVGGAGLVVMGMM